MANNLNYGSILEGTDGQSLVEQVRNSNGTYSWVLRGQKSIRQTTKTAIIAPTPTLTQFDNASKATFQLGPRWAGISRINKMYIKLNITNTTGAAIQLFPGWTLFNRINGYFNGASSFWDASPYSIMCDYSMLNGQDAELNAQMCGYICDPVVNVNATTANYNINQYTTGAVSPEWLIPAGGSLEAYVRVDIGKFLTSHLFHPQLLDNTFYLDCYINSFLQVGAATIGDLVINQMQLVIEGEVYSNVLNKRVMEILSNKKVSIPSIYETVASQVYSNALVTGQSIKPTIPGFNGVYLSLQFGLVKNDATQGNAYTLASNGQLVVAANGVGTQSPPFPVPGQPFSNSFLFDQVNILPDGTSLFYNQNLTYKQLYELGVESTAFSSYDIENKQASKSQFLQNLANLQMIPFSDSVSEDLLSHCFSGGLCVLNSSSTLQLTPVSSISSGTYTLWCYGRRACVTKIDYTQSNVMAEYVAYV